MFTSSMSFEGMQALIKGKDPVCGMEVGADKAAGASTVDQATFYFCSSGCKERFDAEPGKYIQKS